MNPPITSRRNSDLHKRRLAATPRGVGVMGDFFAERADNGELWDVEGRRFIDFAGGIAVLNTGHRHPSVVKALQAQLERFTHTCYQVVPYAGYVDLAERINEITPGDFPKKTAFFTTGVEAVENAVKIARFATGRSAVIAFGGAFHGRTMMGMALTGKVDPYKRGFGPFPGDVYHAPFPDALHHVSVEQSLGAIEALFKTTVDPQRVAAIIIEPVQGEGGFNVAPAIFMQQLRTLCNKHGIVMIADEIQTGFGRTGKLFAMEHYGVVPDLMTMAKSLGAGLPISAVCGRAELMDAPAPGGLGGTYAGNPLAVAAALAVLDVMRTEKIVERGEKLGERLREQLMSLRGEVPQIADVRGLGAMIAVELSDPTTGAPDADFMRRVLARTLADGLILLSCGVYGNVIRFLFPLTISDELMGEALAILTRALRAESAQPAAVSA